MWFLLRVSFSETPLVLQSYRIQVSCIMDTLQRYAKKFTVYSSFNCNAIWRHKPAILHLLSSSRNSFYAPNILKVSKTDLGQPDLTKALIINPVTWPPQSARICPPHVTSMRITVAALQFSYPGPTQITADSGLIGNDVGDSLTSQQN